MKTSIFLHPQTYFLSEMQHFKVSIKFAQFIQNKRQFTIERVQHYMCVNLLYYDLQCTYNVKIVLFYFFVYDTCTLKICNYGLTYKYTVKLILEDTSILK